MRQNAYLRFQTFKSAPPIMEYISQFLNYLLADKGYSPQTTAKYRQDLISFRDFFVNLERELTWKTVDSDVVRQWMAAEMGRNVSARTMKRSLSALRSFYRYLMRMGLAEADPAHKIVNPKADKPLPVFVKEKEMDRLFDEVQFPEDFEGQRDHLILLAFYSTGMRVSELVGLDVEALNFERNELRVTGKRNKQRVIPFGKELSKELRAYLKERATLPCGSRGPLFVRPNGQRQTAADVRRMVKQYLSLVTSQKRRGPHVLRHTFATVMLNNGAELEAVKELLGHESLATTEIYTHTTFAELRREYEKAHPRGDAILKKDNTERISEENLELEK